MKVGVENILYHNIFSRLVRQTITPNMHRDFSSAMLFSGKDSHAKSTRSSFPFYIYLLANVFLLKIKKFSLVAFM